MPLTPETTAVLFCSFHPQLRTLWNPSQHGHQYLTLPSLSFIFSLHCVVPVFSSLFAISSCLSPIFSVGVSNIFPFFSPRCAATQSTSEGLTRASVCVSLDSLDSLLRYTRRWVRCHELRWDWWKEGAKEGRVESEKWRGSGKTREWEKEGWEDERLVLRWRLMEAGGAPERLLEWVKDKSPDLACSLILVCPVRIRWVGVRFRVVGQATWVSQDEWQL